MHISQNQVNLMSLAEQDVIIQNAIFILEQRIFRAGPCLTNPQDVKSYLRLQLANPVKEIFACVFLDSHHRVIKYEPLFFGSIDHTTVHPRIILQRALETHSAAVIMAHNHPTGIVNPSVADQRLTKRLKDLLIKIDVRLIDHFIIGEGEPYSFAEAGLI
ncbi:JAB domain-containing protein [Pseudomonas atacamensis]|uniref:JAB domain-containing protein n=1 Tax=Pseudomonas atacamensis TaxID=2565368 RepID=UPI003C852A95